MAGTDNLLWFESERIRGVIVTQERYFIGVARHRSGWFLTGIWVHTGSVIMLLPCRDVG